MRTMFDRSVVAWTWQGARCPASSGANVSMTRLRRRWVGPATVLDRRRLLQGRDARLDRPRGTVQNEFSRQSARPDRSHPVRFVPWLSLVVALVPSAPAFGDSPDATRTSEDRPIPPESGIGRLGTGERHLVLSTMERGSAVRPGGWNLKG